LIESQESERKRIAAELHDVLGQNLIVIKNWATLGSKVISRDAPVNEHLNEISATAVQSLNDVREIIHNLRPHQLETIGLSNTVRFMVEQVGSSSGIQFKSEIAPLENLFTPDEEVILYRLVQECISNIVKHSRATEATLGMKLVNGNLQIIIADNGQGLGTDPSGNGAGFGLTGLKERVRILRGLHRISSGPGKGTMHTFSIPVRHRGQGGEAQDGG
jgi:two-component system, sensor histidine kinase LadS